MYVIVLLYWTIFESDFFNFPGAGSSITLVSSLCVTADLIGPHSHQGASVYSIVTFADKLVTGIAVVAIEN